MNKLATTTTFKVSDVEMATELLPTISYQNGVERILGCSLEACCSQDVRLISNTPSPHGFLNAVDRAFTGHYSLILSPDIIWLCIIQGLAIHINSHAEELRNQLVYHQGKHTLEVRRDDFMKGSLDNNWSEVIAQFSGQIQEFTKGDIYSLIVADFSTTGAVERTVSEIVLMDMLKEYFEYDLYSLCGIPQITLEGTVADWQLIGQRVEKFTQFGLSWWLKSLSSLIERFIETAEGNINQKFWQSFYKDNGESGGPYVTGWINILFPYLYDSEASRFEDKLLFKRNDYIRAWMKNINKYLGSGPPISDFPSSLSRVPFDWQYRDLCFNMELIGGFMGVSQNQETLALRPEIGWAIIDVNKYRNGLSYY